MSQQQKQPEQLNFYHLVMDVAWFGIALAATSRFMSLYALRLGANPTQLSLIAALPGIVLFVSTGMSGWWRRRYSETLHAIMWPALGFRFVFLLPALAPFFPEHLRPIWLILAVALPALPQGIAGVIFMVMMRESISPDQFASLNSKRSLAMNITVAIGAVAFGILLETVPYPLNYQLMFVLAFGFAVISQWHVLRVKTLFPEPPPVPKQSNVNVWRSRRFQPVAFVAFITHVAFFSVVMVTPQRLVDDLGVEEGFMALFGLLELASGAIAAMFAVQLIHRYGTRNIIAFSMIGTAVAALIFAQAQQQAIVLVGAAISGAAWTSATVSIFTSLFEKTPKEWATQSSIAYQQVIGIGIFIGPLIGGFLVDSIGIELVSVLVVGAGLRLLAGVLTHQNPFDEIPVNSNTRSTRFEFLHALQGRGRRR